MYSYTTRVNFKENNTQPTPSVDYISNPVNNYQVTSLAQSKPTTVKDMKIRLFNKTLCWLLFFAIGISILSYYVAMNYEAKLNLLDSEIIKLNSENQDLQAELDKFKSFNNVDSKIGQYKLLQKAERVIEVTALNTNDKDNLVTPVKTVSDNLNWAVGY